MFFVFSQSIMASALCNIVCSSVCVSMCVCVSVCVGVVCRYLHCWSAAMKSSSKASVVVSVAVALIRNQPIQSSLVPYWSQWLQSRSHKPRVGYKHNIRLSIIQQITALNESLRCQTSSCTWINETTQYQFLTVNCLFI